MLNESASSVGDRINNLLQDVRFINSFLCLQVSLCVAGYENPKSTIPYMVHVTLPLSANLEKHACAQEIKARTVMRK
jgi:hypothetical protein